MAINTYVLLEAKSTSNGIYFFMFMMMIMITEVMVKMSKVGWAKFTTNFLKIFCGNYGGGFKSDSKRNI